MGLLTMDKSGEDESLKKLLKSKSNLLCSLSYFFAIASALALMTEYFVDKTYFSDNAFLPGLVKRDFNEKVFLDEILNGIKVAAKEANGMPHNWFYEQFQTLGLDVHFHNYTLRYPFAKEKVCLLITEFN